MPSSSLPYSKDEQRQLLLVAAKSIQSGLKNDVPLVVDLSNYPLSFLDQRATFVTLNLNGELRGCIGRLSATRPLVEDVAGNAFSAAFQDSRFPRLTYNEFNGLDIHISVLSVPETIPFTNENDLLEKIRPNVDGLILTEDYLSATFLPSVWDSLPKKEEFLQHLKLKAGFPPGYWSDNIKVERYTTFTFGSPISEIAH